MKTVGVVFITHTAKRHLQHCLPPLLQSPLHPRVLVVNSSSNDGTVEEAERLGAETLVIPRVEFNHGSTRERARQHLGTDIVVMMTPDAYAVDIQMLERLIQPILEGRAATSYARQIPHDGADLFEAVPRAFNYPEASHIRGIEEISKYGVYTFFSSDACAAYDNKALDEVGCFPSVLLGEDTCVVAALLKKGKKIAYVAEAVVKHSHRYSLKQEFQRNFDTGLARGDFRELIAAGGTDEKRGIDFVKYLTKQILQQNPLLLPYGFIQVLTKWIGYRLGNQCRTAPIWIKKALSSQDFYWNSKDFFEKQGLKMPQKIVREKTARAKSVNITFKALLPTAACLLILATGLCYLGVISRPTKDSFAQSEASHVQDDKAAVAETASKQHSQKEE